MVCFDDTVWDWNYSRLSRLTIKLTFTGLYMQRNGNKILIKQNHDHCLSNCLKNWKRNFKTFSICRMARTHYINTFKNFFKIHRNLTDRNENLRKTRLLSTISNIYCGVICKHLLFVQYKIKTKKFKDFIKIFAHFQNFTKIKNF